MSIKEFGNGFDITDRYDNKATVRIAFPYLDNVSIDIDKKSIQLDRESAQELIKVLKAVYVL